MADYVLPGAATQAAMSTLIRRRQARDMARLGAVGASLGLVLGLAASIYLAAIGAL